MIRIHVSNDDVATIRFAVDAVWETTGSLHSVGHPRQHLLHQRLAQRVPTDPDFDLDFLLLLTSFTRWIPDILGPMPTGTARDPVGQLDALRATDRAVARSDLRTIGELSPGNPIATMTPEQYVDTVAVALTGYWRAVIEPLWERIVAIDEADIAYHHATLARAGIAQAIRDLHDKLRYDDGAVLADVPGVELERPAGGRGVWFIPSVFRWPWLSVNHESPQPVICYAARGAARVWEKPGHRPLSLAGVIGRSRSAILHVLDVPRTTTWLSGRLELAPATVSSHLSVMTSSGLLESRRNGRHVLYSRTEVADLLVAGGSALHRLG